MKEFKKHNILSKFDCAFSRENNKIKYVQDVIKSNASDIVKNVVTKEARIYVCGDTTMAKDVQESIIQAIVLESNLNKTEARSKIADMRLNDEYLQDIW